MRFRIGVFTLLFGLLLFLAFNRHSKDKHNDYHSVLWSDAAGYHVYLPLVFTDYFSHLNDNEKDSLLNATGRGFTLRDGRVQAKYTYGVSLLQAPFFIAVHQSIGAPEMFSAPYQNAALVASVFFGFLGLVLIYLALNYEIESWRVRFLIFMLLGFGTNLFFYMVDSPGFSHSFSFFAFSSLVFLVIKNRHSDSLSTKSILLLVSTLSLIAIIRPFNILFALIYCFGFFGRPILNTVRNSFNSKQFILLGVVFILVPALFVFPQVWLWKIMYGKWLLYSYSNEGFDNLLSPYFIEVLFSTNNGLLLYTPFWVLVLFVLFRKMTLNNKSYVLLFIFLIGVYLYASWWAWELGCSFGYRAFVDILPLFALPVAKYFEESFRKMKHKVSLLLLALILVAFNLKVTYSYDKCWHSGELWDYQKFSEKLVFGKTR